MRFYGVLMYNELISKVYFLCKLEGTISFSFVNKELKDHYNHDDNGPCCGSQIIFKMLLLEFFYDVSEAGILHWFHIVQIAYNYKPISDKLHIVDGTVVKAKVCFLKIKRKQSYVYEQTSDKDARFGYTLSNDVFFMDTKDTYGWIKRAE
jgi:hypothetical protein